MHSHHASFLPQVLIRHARSGLLESGDGAFSLLHPGVLLFTDISGFTALTERFAASNASAGAEQLTSLLNNYFDPLIRGVHAYGGDIIKFAGDAMLILWVEDVEAGHTLHFLTENAIACAHELQRIMRDVAALRGETLGMKAAVSVGPIRQVCLGGVLGRRDMLLTGDALSELGRANDYAKPGDVIVCGSAVSALEQAFAELASQCATTSVATRASHTATHCKPLIDPSESTETPDNDAASAMLSLQPPMHAMLPPIELKTTASVLPNPEVSAEAAEVLRTFIPAAIRKALDANQAEWVSENRLVSLLFVNLRDFSDGLPVDFEQTAMRAIQTALYKFEGSLNKISVDDKGVSLLGAFGMPPFRHADDPLRAVRAAKAICASLDAQGLSCAIGVTTGRVYCGVVGNGIRREYTVMGDVVNLSARLMGNALKRKSGFPIMVDETTWRATHDKLSFGEVEYLKLKGKANPVPAYQPLDTHVPGVAQAGGDTRALLGRDVELGLVRQAALDVLQQDRPLLVDINGSVGSGRRHLSRAAIDIISRDGFMVWRLSCSAMQQFSAWQAFGPVFRGLLAQRDPEETLEHFQQRVMAALPQDEWWQQRAALLEAVVPAHWPDSPVTAALSGEARAQATGDFLCRLLLQRLGSQPVCIRIRDVEWMDRASVSLCKRLLESAPHLLLICLRDTEHTQGGFWPNTDEWPQANYRSVSLPALGAPVLLDIAKDHLNFVNPPTYCLRLLEERAGGSPLHAIQIMQAVKDAGDNFNTDELPDSVQGLIVSRIDRLLPEMQLIGKIVSVAIADMDFATLHRLHPSQPEQTLLAEQCHALADQGFIRTQSLDPDKARGMVQFAHASAQQTFYSLLPVAQRRLLHQRMAAHLDDALPDTALQLDHLAYHWLRACETTFGAQPDELELSVLKACGTLLEQARRNTRLGALLEAEQQFQHVVSLGKTHQMGVTREVEIDALLGLSSVRFSRFGWADDDAAQALEQARRLCDGSARRLPVFSAIRGLWQIHVGKSDYQKSLKLAQEMSQFAQQTSSDDDARIAMQAEAHRALGTTCFWLGRFEDAERYLRETLDFPDVTQGDGLNLTQDTRVTTLGMLGWALAIQGKHDQTTLVAQQAIAEAQQRGGAFSLAYVHGTAMWAFLHLSDIEQARSHAQQTLEISQAKGFEYLATAAHVVFGWAKAWQGDAAGIDEIATAVEQWRGKGQSIGVPAFLLQWVRALRRHGRMEEAQDLLDSEPFQAGLRTEPWISLLAKRMLDH